jgi:CheY-like chemotaxis protein
MIPDSHKPSSTSTRGSLRVLIVDDDPIMATNLVELLFFEGYEAHAVNSGEAALASIRSARPDIILSDVRLPGIDGLTLLRSLRNNPHTARIPFVFMTGMADANRHLTEANGYLSKPFHINDFLAVIQANV